MGKYVYVKKNDKEDGKYYEVNDFSFETISNMPFYKQKYEYFELWSGNKRMFGSEILDIYPGKRVKIVCYGKRISYEDVKKIILNDPKYENILDSMNHASTREYMYLHTGNDEDKEKVKMGEEEFCKKFDKEHYCLFMPPDKFYTGIFNDKDSSVSIEEYDSNIKLDYSKELSLILLNSQLGYKYNNNNKSLLIVFDNFFNMLLRNIQYFSNEHALFTTIKFDFKTVGFKDEDTIGYFLDYYSYAMKLEGKKLDLFNKYKNYVFEQENEITYGHDY